MHGALEWRPFGGKARHPSGVLFSQIAQTESALYALPVFLLQNLHTSGRVSFRASAG
jgi:hypothetical protein